MKTGLHTHIRALCEERKEARPLLRLTSSPPFPMFRAQPIFEEKCRVCARFRVECDRHLTGW
jgi:hypothetical protein